MANDSVRKRSSVDSLQTEREANKSCDATSMHRIAEVREQQGISLRAISRRTGVDVRDLKQQESPESNLTLADLYRWQEALEVPIENLLVDHDLELSDPIQKRAAMVKIMKTVVALTEVASSPRITRLTAMLRGQMIELMPELAEIGGWPNFGSRRPPDQQGRIADNPINTLSLSLD
jgi:transcriptional regulator with XRE-family HTH domain